MPLGIGRTYDPKAILLSALTAYRQEATILAKNLSNRDSPGYVAEAVTLNEKVLGGISGGLQVSSIYQAVDESLVGLVRDQNSSIGELQALANYFSSLDTYLGDPRSQTSFAHLGKAMSDALKSVEDDPINPGKRLNAANAINAHVSSIVQLANNVQTLRAGADSGLATTATTVNTILSNIASYNEQLFVATSSTNSSGEVLFPLIDIRRQALQDLSEYLGVNVLYGESNQVTVLAKSGEVLVQGSISSSFAYTSAASVTATSTLSDLTLNGFGVSKIVTATFQDSAHSGQFKGLLELRDQVLPGLQQQLDVYTMNLRDSLNAIHNKGASTTPPNTLTGTIGAPGVVGALTNATVISGSDNLRVAVLDANGNVVGTAADLVLGANTTVGAFITALNAASGGNFTASLTAAGQLRIAAANPAYGVAIGSSVAGTLPTMCAGAAYSALSAYGVSHFFGLNNLIQTGTSLPGQANIGISNLANLRPDILQSAGKYLATGTLSSKTPVDTPAVAARDSGIMSALYQQMVTPNILFNSTTASAQVTTSLLGYSSSIVDLYAAKINTNNSNLQISQYTYEGFSSRANEISGVDPRQTIQECIELSTSQSLVIKAMNIMIEMDRALLDIIT